MTVLRQPETRRAGTLSQRVDDEVMEALALSSVQERLTTIGVEKLPMTVAEFDKFFKDDIATNLALVKAANIPRQ